MRVATIDANETLSRLGFPEKTGTFVSSPIFSVSDETPADAYVETQLCTRNILDIWKHLITEVLNELVHRHVQEYMERYLEMAEESPRYFYVPDIVTTATVERAMRIRGARFAQKERFIVYTPEELNNLF